jgi:hypothetical protein
LQVPKKIVDSYIPQPAPLRPQATAVRWRRREKPAQWAGFLNLIAVLQRFCGVVNALRSPYAVIQKPA